MKQRLLLLFISLCCALPMMAQFTPQGFNYQSVVRDNATGQALTNKTLTLLFTIRTGAPNGQTAYSEKQVTSTNEFGLVNLVVGTGGTPIFGTFDAINWGGGSKWLTVSVQNPNDPAIFNELGSSQLMSVPYALYSKESANGGGDGWGTQAVETSPSLSGDGTNGSPLGIAPQGATPGQVLKWNGTAWAPAADIDTDTDTNSGGTVQEIATGTGLTGGPITGTGTISLANTTVAPGVYGSKTLVPVITIDAQGRITSAGTEAITPTTLNGGAGIDVQLNNGNYTVTNIGDANAGDDLLNTTNFSGDVSGLSFDLQLRPGVVGTTEILDNSVASGDIQDNAVTTQDLATNAVTDAKLAPNAVTAEKLDDMGAASGQVLKWNGAAWAPAADNSGAAALNLTPGSGISITGTAPNLTIANTGDTDASNDITTTSTANGDVSGTFGDLQIKTGVVTALELAANSVETSKVANQAITAAKLDDMGAANGQILKWNGTTWAPAADAVGPTFEVLAGTGIDVNQSGNSFVVFNSGDTNAFDDLTTLSTANGDVSGTFDNLQLKPLVVTSTELANNAVTTTNIIAGAVTAAKLNNMGAGAGQVLKYNGTAWAPSDDNTGGGGNNYAAGTGVSITGTAPNFTINNTGDTNAADDLTTASTADGDVNGPFNNLQIKADVVTTTELANNAVETANVVNQAITGAKIAPMSAANGQVLKWNGTVWVPADDNTGGGGGGNNYAAGPGVSITGTAPNLTINNTGDINASDDITTITGADGDLAGTFNNLQIKAAAVGTLEIAAQAVTGAKIDQMSATNGQVLKWNGATWAPADDIAGGGGLNLTAGPGITLTGTSPNITINNSGDTNAADDLTTASTADGDVSGPFNNLQIKANVVTTTELANNAVETANVVDQAITAAKIDDMGAANGQVIKWNGTTWAPAADNAGNLNLSAGPGISITGTAPNQTINNTGDTNAADDLTTASTADGDVSGPFNNLQIKANVVTTTELADNAVETANIATQAVTGAKIDDMGAANGQVLTWNGTTWAPATTTGDNWGSQTVATNATLAGTGLAGSPLSIAQQGATNGQVLRWNGTAWAPSAVTGDNWGSQTVITAATLSGTGIAGNALTIAQQGALGGQVLKWNGTAWAPANDEVGTGGGTNNNYAAGAGISITGTAPNFVINNIGDADSNPANEIQVMSLTGNQLSLSLGGGTVNLPAGNNYTAGPGIALTGTAPNISIDNTGDLSNTNEIQTLALAGNTLSLSLGGGSVTIPGGNTYTAGAGISITGTAPNLVIANTGDSDNSPTNELQTVSLVGPVLTLSGNNSSVDLSGLLGGGGLWELNANDIFNTNNGSVVVGSAAPAASNAKFQVTNGGTAEAVLVTQGGSETGLVVQHAGTGAAGFFSSDGGPALTTGTGNVGINTKTPSTRLHVEGEGLMRSGGALAQLGLENTGGGFARMSLKSNGGTGRWNVMGRTGSSNEFAIEYTGATKNRVITAIPDSAIIIGSPAATASVRAFTGNDGLFLVNSNNNHNWEFWVTNTVVGSSGNLALYNDQLGAGVPAGTFAINGLYTPSDSRLKKDVSAIAPGVLGKMMQLQPLSYRYKAEKATAKPSLGFLAQDVQAVFPELVGENPTRDGKETFLSLNYAGFGVLAVKAVQEQQAEIEGLKREKQDLKQQVESLETRLKRLEELAAPKR